MFKYSQLPRNGLKNDGPQSWKGMRWSPFLGLFLPRSNWCFSLFRTLPFHEVSSKSLDCPALRNLCSPAQTASLYSPCSHPSLISYRPFSKSPGHEDAYPSTQRAPTYLRLSTRHYSGNPGLGLSPLCQPCLQCKLIE